MSLRSALSGVVGRGRETVEGARVGVSSHLERRRRDVVPLDLAVRFYERDRDAFASVLGAAIALRLFLFVVPAVITVVGLVLVALGPDGIRGGLETASVTGGLAAQVREATDHSRSTGLGVLASGLVLLVWAGRSLTRVLASCAAGAWGMPASETRTTFRMAAAVTTLVLGIFVVGAAINRVRAEFGLAAETMSWMVGAVVFSLGWFAVTLTLPRATSDPGALLPGAVLMGVAFALLQWFMQLYLPGRVERASELAGNVGWSLALLGYMFAVGRLAAASLVLNATVWSRLGSVSELAFALPVVRRLPARFPWIADFFDLDHGGTEVGVARSDGRQTASPDPDPDPGPGAVP